MSVAVKMRGTVTAVLGPTNTGKTTYAIDRMLGHKTGVMGFPLRLLAREVYDRIVDMRGPSVVALVTGEEKIVPPNAKYFICTVESMPLEQGADFVAIDEIQLCADPERGHVFTDRLLNARGMHETLLLGALTMRDKIANLIPGVKFAYRNRFSELSYVGSKKVSRLPPRSAIVAFSTDQVYAIAELIRRQKGGAAVVMGALSPRTRNAQVAMFQEGEVEYLVATDAIGMGLNLDLKSVWFAGAGKFDGRRHRRLEPQELAQIAGRAGRYKENGSFGRKSSRPSKNTDFMPSERCNGATIACNSLRPLPCSAALMRPPLRVACNGCAKPRMSRPCASSRLIRTSRMLPRELVLCDSSGMYVRCPTFAKRCSANMSISYAAFTAF